MSDKFFSLTELGRLYGVSSHKIGKWLMDLGLRDQNKKPSRTAFDNGFVQQRDSTNIGTYYWVWHFAKTCQALEKAGHKMVPQT
jgi:hypothetical protein